VTKRYTFRAPKAQAPEKVPRVARLLALAHKFQKMIDSREVESMAELARLGRVSRARITQIMDLLMLAPEIQDAILAVPFDPERVAAVPRDLVTLCAQPAWQEQRRRWRLARVSSSREPGRRDGGALRVRGP
jgi:hypothetical protein